jgi:hypothetical protein
VHWIVPSSGQLALKLRPMVALRTTIRVDDDQFHLPSAIDFGQHLLERSKRFLGRPTPKGHDEQRPAAYGADDGAIGFASASVRWNACLKSLRNRPPPSRTGLQPAGPPGLAPWHPSSRIYLLHLIRPHCGLPRPHLDPAHHRDAHTRQARRSWWLVRAPSACVQWKRSPRRSVCAEVRSCDSAPAAGRCCSCLRPSH